MSIMQEKVLSKSYKNKDMKISFIAFEVGYNDVSHFIQSFKKSYGLTPEEYRARKKIE